MPLKLRDVIAKTVRQVIAETPLSRIGKDKVYSSSGNPQLELAGESSTTRGSKEHKIIQPGPPALNANGIHLEGPERERAFAGTLVDVSDYQNQATGWRGVNFVIPGNTSTLATLNNEQSTSNTSFTTVKRLRVPYPGTYRFVFDLKRDAGLSATATARVVLITASGDVVAVSGETTTTSASYGSKTLDMTVTVWPGDVLALQLKTDNGSSPAYAQNLLVKYSTATSDPTVSGSVLLD